MSRRRGQAIFSCERVLRSSRRTRPRLPGRFSHHAGHHQVRSRGGIARRNRTHHRYVVYRSRAASLPIQQKDGLVHRRLLRGIIERRGLVPGTHFGYAPTTNCLQRGLPSLPATANTTARASSFSLRSISTSKECALRVTFLTRAPVTSVPARSFAANCNGICCMPAAGTAVSPAENIRKRNSKNRLEVTSSRSRKTPPKKGSKNRSMMSALKELPAGSRAWSAPAGKTILRQVPRCTCARRLATLSLSVKGR